MSTPDSRGKALKGLKTSPTGARNARHFERLRVRSCHLKTTDSLEQLAASYSDHP